MFSFVAMVTQLYQICGYFIFNGLFINIMMHTGIQSYICQQNYSMLEMSDMVLIAILADFDP